MHGNLVKGILLSVTAAILWGVSGTFGQFLFQEREINVEWMITIRMTCSGLLLLAISLVRRDMKIFAVFKDRKDVLQLGLFSITGMLMVQYT